MAAAWPWKKFKIRSKVSVACKGARTGEPGAAGPRTQEGKERTSFFRPSFLSIRRDEGHHIRASALSHTSLSSRPNSGKVTRCTPFSNLPGVGGCSSSCSSFFFLLVSFFSFSLSSFPSLLSLFYASSYARLLTYYRSTQCSLRIDERLLLWDCFKIVNTSCRKVVDGGMESRRRNSDGTWVFFACCANELWEGT